MENLQIDFIEKKKSTSFSNLHKSNLKLYMSLSYPTHLQLQILKPSTFERMSCTLNVWSSGLQSVMPTRKWKPWLYTNLIFEHWFIKFAEAIKMGLLLLSTSIGIQEELVKRMVCTNQVINGLALRICPILLTRSLRVQTGNMLKPVGPFSRQKM